MRHLAQIALLLSAACASQATEELHPDDGTLHHPAGLCAIGEQVHVISTNHDLRYRSGAVLSYAKADLVSGDAAKPKQVANTSQGLLPEGFGQVLNLALCDAEAGRLILLDRVKRQHLRLSTEADGSLRCPDEGCVAVDLGGLDEEGLSTGISDPGAAVAAGDDLLFSSRIDEKATLQTADGTLERVGGSSATRPVLGGPWLLGRASDDALLLSDGEVTTLRVEGWTGARWGVSDGGNGGYLVSRFGDQLIAFDQVGDALVSRWHAPLRGHRRRVYRVADELLALGGTDHLVERRSPIDGRLLGVIRAVDLDEPEGAAMVDADHVLVSAFTGHKLILLDLLANASRTVVSP